MFILEASRALPMSGHQRLFAQRFGSACAYPARLSGGPFPNCKPRQADLAPSVLRQGLGDAERRRASAICVGVNFKLEECREKRLAASFLARGGALRISL
jgi:hypothetical protein